VFGVGPQIEDLFPVGEMQGYLSLMGYKEFGAEHRADSGAYGFTISRSAKEAASAKHMVTK
jgi:hypothetical protein